MTSSPALTSSEGPKVSLCVPILPSLGYCSASAVSSGSLLPKRCSLAAKRLLVENLTRCTAELIGIGIVLALVLSESFASAQEMLPSDGVKNIITSAECLNMQKPNDLSDAVVCIPQGCKITLNMSLFSDQKACFIPNSAGGKSFQAPHVLLNCPGPKAGLRLRPSVTLCPNGRTPGENDIEYGEDPPYSEKNKVPGSKLTMAAVEKFPAGGAGGITWPVDQKIFNLDVGGGSGSLPCTLCHGNAGTMPIAWGKDTFEVVLSHPNDPFGFVMRRNSDMVDFVIYTTEPNKKNLSYPAIPSCGNDCRQQTLAAICTDLGTLNGAENKRRAELCKALMGYEQDRGCGTGKQGDLERQCKGIVGGGLFMKKGEATTLSDGRVPKPEGIFSY